MPTETRDTRNDFFAHLYSARESCKHLRDWKEGLTQSDKESAMSYFNQMISMLGEMKTIPVDPNAVVLGGPSLVKKITNPCQTHLGIAWDQLVDGKCPQCHPKVRTCNRHFDCDEADKKAQQKGDFYATHCHDECCPDCFGD